LATTLDDYFRSDHVLFESLACASFVFLLLQSFGGVIELQMVDQSQSPIFAIWQRRTSAVPCCR
jgi:hypothetical protein